MQCPHCRLENVKGADYCSGCGRRLYLWLGDPFGNQDLWEGAAQALVPAGAGTSTVPSAGVRAFPWLKATLGGLFLYALLPFGLVGKSLAIGAVVALLWRFRGIGCFGFGLVIVFVLFVAWILFLAGGIDQWF
jgi:hypothetical protein